MTELPSYALLIAAALIMFGRQGLLLIPPVLGLACFKSQVTSIAQSWFGVTVDVTSIIDAAYGVFMTAGFALHYIFRGRLPLTLPRGISPAVALLILAAIFFMIGYTNAKEFADAVGLYFTKQIREFIVNTFESVGFGSVLVMMMCIYMVVVPHMIRFLERIRMPMLSAGIFAFFMSFIISSITLEVTAGAIELAMKEAKMNAFMWLLFAGSVGVVAVAEIMRALRTFPVYLLCQMPAILCAASLVRGTGLESVMSPVINFATVALLFITLMYFMIGIARGSPRDYAVACAVAGAFMVSTTSYSACSCAAPPAQTK